MNPAATTAATLGAATLTAAVVMGACADGGPEDPADLVLVNGDVYTIDEARPAAEAVAVRGEHIAVVGSNAQALALAGPDARVIDLDGAFVSPGFTDGHVHVESTGALIVGVNLRVNQFRPRRTLDRGH